MFSLQLNISFKEAVNTSAQGVSQRRPCLRNSRTDSRTIPDIINFAKETI